MDSEASLISPVDHEKYRLLGSLKAFTELFYFQRHGRPFLTPHPEGRAENHAIQVMRELVSLFDMKSKHLCINIPPGYGKSTLLVMFISWCYAHYHDCQFIYISYGQELAETHTAEIKAIIELPLFRQLFGVRIDPTSSARGDFRVIHDSKPGVGRVCAKGSASGITGLNAGLQEALDDNGNPRFSGCCIMDDLHKPDEVHSDVKRERVIKNYNETIKMRARSQHVGAVLLGQRLSEDDICNFILSGQDGLEWRHVILQGLDENESALAPWIMSKERLLIEREINAYTFYSQIQQQPTPRGGALFKKEWWKLLHEEPEFLCTFETVDCAESERKHADFTVFSFWGLYEIKINRTSTGEYALHWIDCHQVKCEPKDIESEFLSFHTACLRHKNAPRFAAIERKSAGTTLVSVLKNVPGVRIIPIERSSADLSKTDRFLQCQRYVAGGHLSFNNLAPHREMCIEHMAKITANNTHKHDDIADTCADAINIALIEKSILRIAKTSDIDQTLNQDYAKLLSRTEQNWKSMHR